MQIKTQREKKDMDNPTVNFEDIFKDEPGHLNLSDGTLLTEDGYSFRIHKIVLAKCSKYFHARFCRIETGKRDYLIQGITGEVLSNILWYIYTKHIRLTERNIFDIIMASDYLLLNNLISHMNEVLEKNLSFDNCLPIHMNANKRDILRKTYRFIETNFEELIGGMGETLPELPIEFLKEFFDDRNLRVQSENVVWQVIVKWVEADLSNRTHEVPDLLMYLRINGVDENLAREIVTHAIVARNTFCETIIFGSRTSYRNILKLHQCHVWNDAQKFPFYIQRKPSHLNFIAYYPLRGESENTQIYVTYDENVDLWRELLEVNPRPDYLVCIHDCIYLFYMYGEIGKMRFNVIEKQWVEFTDFRVQRFGHVVVTLGGFLYLLGGSLNESTWLQEVYDVEVYDPKENAWHDTAPMLPITRNISAVTLNGRIYIVGDNTTRTRMSAQMYDPSTEIWIKIPHPSISEIIYFSLVVYNEKIYIIGRTHESDFLNAEVFDPFLNAWSILPNLTSSYFNPRALVINDRLIACSDPSRARNPCYDPPMQWNDERHVWEPLAKSSPLFNIHDYFFTVQDGDDINEISKENKMPTTVFEKCPFS